MTCLISESQHEPHTLLCICVINIPILTTTESVHLQLQTQLCLECLLCFEWLKSSQHCTTHVLSSPQIKVWHSNVLGASVAIFNARYNIQFENVQKIVCWSFKWPLSRIVNWIKWSETMVILTSRYYPTHLHMGLHKSMGPYAKINDMYYLKQKSDTDKSITSQLGLQEKLIRHVWSDEVMNSTNKMHTCS